MRHLSLVFSSPVEDHRSLNQVEADLEAARIDLVRQKLSRLLEGDCYRRSYLEIAQMWLQVYRAVPDDFVLPSVAVEAVREDLAAYLDEQAKARAVEMDRHEKRVARPRRRAAESCVPT